MNFLLFWKFGYTHTFTLSVILDFLSSLVRVGVGQSDYCAAERDQGEQLNLTTPHSLVLLIELSLWGSAPLSYKTGVLISNSICCSLTFPCLAK